jgi:hypothetical protein
MVLREYRRASARSSTLDKSRAREDDLKPGNGARKVIERMTAKRNRPRARRSRAPLPSPAPAPDARPPTPSVLRIWRSPYSNFQKDETLHAAKAYPPARLREIAAAGFTAIWIHALLHDVAPSRVFPLFGRRSAAHLAALRAVIRRAARCGLKVYLYMQPPRGLLRSHPFWRRHPEARGAEYVHAGEEFYALCTSEPKVRDWLRRAAEDLSRALPGLGGAILITASEYVGHCYSKYPYLRSVNPPPGAPPMKPLSCPRCAARHPAEIVAEIIRAVHAGFRDAAQGAEVIAWNWSWSLYEEDPSPRILASLPPDVRLLIDFERGARKVVLGKERFLDEYSLGYVGPSERFLKTYRAARARGLRVMAKLQIGTTHELATVANLPLIGNLYDKARALRRLKVADFLGCWNFGNMLTANTAAFNRFMDAASPPPRRRALEAFAAEYFPGCNPARVLRAWLDFARAMERFPFSMGMLYNGPMNYAVARPILPAPLDGKPAGRSWLPDPRGDVLPAHGYDLEEITRGFGELAARWEAAADLLARGLAGCRARTARQELLNARVAGHCFRSTWNLYRAQPIRREWRPDRAPELAPILQDECDHLARALPLVAADPRMGFHSECQFRMFTPAAIARKLRRLRRDLASIRMPR